MAFVTATLPVTFLGLFVQAAGYAIPLWLSFYAGLEDAKIRVFVGVWYSTACINRESVSCESKSIEPMFNEAGQYDIVKINGTTEEQIVEAVAIVFGHNVYWWVVQLATTVGLFLTLLATLVLLCDLCAETHSKCLFVITAILLFFGGLLSVGIAALFAVVIVIAFSFLDSDFDAETFPWSVLIFAIGGVIAFAASILTMIITCNWRRYGAYEEEGSASFEAVPMSHVNNGYSRDTHDHRNEYNSYDRERNGFDRADPREDGGYNQHRY